MYGGNLVVKGGNYYLTGTGTNTAKGGIIYASSGGNVTIEGGEFWGGNYKQGGAIGITSNNLTITGGIIHAGSATNGDSIYAASNDTTALNVVIGGDAVIEGGVELVKGAADVNITVSGKPVLECVEGGSAYSLKLPEGVKITVGALEAEALIRVSAAADSVIATLADETAAANAAVYFETDEAGMSVVADGVNLVYKATTAA